MSQGTAAIVYGQLGLLALERGALDEAVVLLDRGIAGIGDDAEYRAPMLVNRSVAHSQAGRLAAARADVEAAARDYQTAGGEVERAMAMHNAGYIALLEGDLIAALETMGEARGALAAASAVNAAICDLDRAEVLRDAGLAREAEQSLERVIGVFAANRMRQAKGQAQFHLARSLLTHTPAGAVTTAGAAVRTFRAIGSDWWALRADALRLRAMLTPEAESGRARRRVTVAVMAEVDELVGALQASGLRAEATALRLTRELWRSDQPGSAVPSVALRTPRTLRSRCACSRTRSDPPGRQHAVTNPRRGGMPPPAWTRSPTGSARSAASISRPRSRCTGAD